MRQRLLSLFAVLSLLCFGATSAQAGKVPIPCTGEKIVKVQDLPDMGLPNGKRLALGYKYASCFSGQFVGYIGSSSSYLPLTPQAEQAMGLLLPGGKMPAEPGFFWGLFKHPGAFFAEWLWIVIIGFVGIGVAFKKSDNAEIEAPADADVRQTAPAARQAAVAPAASAPAPARERSSPVQSQPASAAAANRLARIAKPAPGFGRRTVTG